MILRPYQQACISSLDASLQVHRSALCVMATGTGKTVCFSHMAHRTRGRTLVVAHRAELIEQAANKIRAVTGLAPDIEMADQRASGMYKAPVVVASIQTLTAGRKGAMRMDRFDPGEFDLLVLDEAHHATSATWVQMTKRFMANPELRIAGFTATTDRLDRMALGSVFETVAFRYEILDAIADGWLVPLVAKQVFVKEIDLTEVRSVAGDLNQKDLAKVMDGEAVCHQVVKGMLANAPGMKCLVFASSVHNAHLMADIANASGVSAACIDGKTDKVIRRRIIRAYAAGNHQHLYNMGIATEGFDDPSIQCVGLARPTESRMLVVQMCGRGTRPLPGIVDIHDCPVLRRDAIAHSAKPSVLVLDFVGNCGRHKLAGPVDIFSGKYPQEVVDAAKAMLTKEQDAAVPADMASVMDAAALAVAQAKERKARLHVDRIDYEVKLVDAFGTFGIGPERLRDASRKPPLTQKQRDWVARSGVDVLTTPPDQLIAIHGEMVNRMRRNLCTLKQAKALQKYGYDTSKMSMPQASVLLDRLKNNRWKPLGDGPKKPHGVHHG